MFQTLATRNVADLAYLANIYESVKPPGRWAILLIFQEKPIGEIFVLILILNLRPPTLILCYTRFGICILYLNYIIALIHLFLKYREMLL